MFNNEFFFELQKLRESSKNAVAQGNSPSLDYFQKYLHVEREVEKNLSQRIMECSKSSKAELILVCGNVGDGKSHILSHLNNKLKEDIINFKIHNDATESHNPNETSNDTLNRVLEDFKDININKSNKKLILAINLGTLSKFQEEYEADYKQLFDYVNEQKILEADVIHDSKNDSKSNFHHVNFTDYHMYSLSSEGPKSIIISNLLERIVANSRENPIFAAYENYIEYFEYAEMCPIKYNYEFLMNAENRDIVINLIIQAIVKNKLIVSVRSLLNFFFELIVPINLSWDNLEVYTSDINKFKESDYLSSIIPNYLFEHPELSSLFNAISKLDPCRHRYEGLDSTLILLINSDDPKVVFSKNINKKPLEVLSNRISKDNLTREEITKLFIRLKYFQRSEEKLKLSNTYYNQFMSLLYDFNNNKKTAIKEIYKLVEESARRWNGDPKKNNRVVINLGKNQLKYRVLKEFSTEPAFDKKTESNDLHITKFLQEFTLSFKLKKSETPYKIHIDYRLYEILNRILKGYRPNKKDNNNNISFVSLINNFISDGDSNSMLEIDKINIGKPADYVLSIDSFGEYKFQLL
ncbi:DNA phosphorothioation-dependent restriction protein DptF [Cellulophaga sp. Ld12]|uniref:DNA phosphorothioation-dependent restriction protein DptF n=1 Tax=Cellulophaga sp. Ld12 TaxID=3229535 RepID=UPI00386B8B9E